MIRSSVHRMLTAVAVGVSVVVLALVLSAQRELISMDVMTEPNASVRGLAVAIAALCPMSATATAHVSTIWVIYIPTNVRHNNRLKCGAGLGTATVARFQVQG